MPPPLFHPSSEDSEEKRVDPVGLADLYLPPKCILVWARGEYPACREQQRVGVSGPIEVYGSTAFDTFTSPASASLVQYNPGTLNSITPEP